MSEFVNMVQIPEVTKNQLLEYLKDDDKEAWNIKPMVVGLTAYCDKVINAPVLSQLLDALGWHGGTVVDALAEVRRLRGWQTQVSAKIRQVSRHDDVMPFPSAIESGGPRCPDLAAWLKALDNATGV